MKCSTAKLFYSYCHADENHREEMEKSLSILRRNKLLLEWCDRKIIAGQTIPTTIHKEMEDSDIVVFLISRSFLNSEACMSEWGLAKSMQNSRCKRLISVIVSPSSWEDFDDLSDYLVLPEDGVPITLWNNVDEAWKNVYDGIKSVIEDIRKSFEVKIEFKESLSSIEFCSQSQERISLEDIFVFPQLYTSLKDSDDEVLVRDENDLLKNQYVLIRGEDQSGKTKLCSHLFFNIIDNHKPGLYINLEDIKSKKPSKDIFSQKYNEQFCGDYELWLKQESKTVIFDNLTHDANSLRHVVLAEELFENIVVATSNDNFSAYFKDELALTDYFVVRMATFTHGKQEQLIRRWMCLRKDANTESTAIEHGQIDQVERNINAIIISNKILPRYPFFILSILQTYEMFMPRDLQITAYGHCYYTLILAHLIKSGIDKRDDVINPCLNFSSHLAFEIHKKSKGSPSISKEDYGVFVSEYKSKYIISDSLLNRMVAPNGILRVTSDGYYCFSLPYSYYFFLGRHLANSFKENSDFVAKMIEKSFIKENTLSLIFAIHHAQDMEILDDILLHTVCAVDNVEPSRLDKQETLVFKALMSKIPHQILSTRSVEDKRQDERDALDKNEKHNDQTDIKESDNDLVNQIYKSNKNIEILSQILKNKAGSLEKSKVEEIIEIICDAGLRMIKLLLVDEGELRELTKYIEKRYEESKEYDENKAQHVQANEIGNLVRYNIFLWTMSNIEKIVSSLSKPELREVIKSVRDKRDTPAYDIIYYFYSLDVSTSFDENQKQELKKLISKYNKKDMFFLHRVLSLRTQHYINTHKIKAPVKQATSSLLDIEYKPM